MCPQHTKMCSSTNQRMGLSPAKWMLKRGTMEPGPWIIQLMKSNPKFKNSSKQIEQIHLIAISFTQASHHHTSTCSPIGYLVARPLILGGFLKKAYPQSPSILDWDFPFNQPANLGVYPLFIIHFLGIPTIISIGCSIRNQSLETMFHHEP